MTVKYLLLIRSIEDDLVAIERLCAGISAHAPSSVSSEDELIVLAYYLHNLYNAFENVFKNIARAFENNLDDAAGWHTQLLQRMRLDIMPIRPAVIDMATYDALDELRRFRHLFRYGYNVSLDAGRLQLVWTRAMQLRATYRPQIDRFMAFLTTLNE
jgi:hypothetical protein